MATAATTTPIAALSNRCSPTIHPISPHSIPSKPSIQTIQSPPTIPSSSSSLLFDDSLTIAAALQAVSLANAAAQAARDATSSALALSEMAFASSHEFQLGKDGIGMYHDQINIASIESKQKRRKRRRKGAELLNFDSNSCWEQRRQLLQCYRERYLTRKEEAEFSRYLKEGARLETIRKKIRDTRKQDPTLAQWAEAVGMNEWSLEELLRRTRECKEKIAVSYKRLVVTIATPYLGKGLSLQDLVQEGCIGLLQGAERFDSKKGCKLSTYVYWWIKQAIIKAVANKSRSIRLPGNLHGLVARIAEANNSLRNQLGRWPTYEEIADIVNVDVSNIRLVTEKTRAAISMDQHMSDEGSITLKEITAGPEEIRPEAMVARQQMKQEIDGLLKTLSEREEYILRLSFGLNGETARSCDEIGRLLKLSRERIRQIQSAAIKKLQQKSNIYSLQVYM